MTTQVQELIDKIKTEGVQEAENKAGEIEQQAQKKKSEIIQEAKAHAEQLIADAEQESKKTREATRAALVQASRDMILNLRKEIENILMKVVSHDVHKALTAEVLTELIGEMVKNQKGGDIKVTLSPKDLKKLQDGFIAKLKTRIKEPITFHAADDISAGFTISFDEGKSCFDFTDESLVEYLGGYLNTGIASLLKDSCKC